MEKHEDGKWKEDEMDRVVEMPLYVCQKCGQELNYDAVEDVLRCETCGRVLGIENKIVRI